MALRREKKAVKMRVLFVDSMNDLPSQLAEYWTRKTYPDLYEAYSAGPEYDIVDCDLLGVMYGIGEDLRGQVSKGFSDDKILPKDGRYDYVVYTQQDVFEALARKSPWQGRQICVHLGTRKEFQCTDDKELAECLVAMSDRVREWVIANMDDPAKLGELVSA
ncbi:hypothetical protein PAA26_00470 [Methanomassiliicoccaceae archaeon COG_1]|nr:hypothetical protein [Methanomassiliicoccaceae archaeon COG_1]